MNLRALLQQAVHRNALQVAHPRECNRATPAQNAQLSVQQSRNACGAILGEPANCDATASATVMQLPSCTSVASGCDRATDVQPHARLRQFKLRHYPRVQCIQS